MKKFVKKIYKQSNCFIHRYLNGTKGAISLLLVLCLTPFLSLALLLEEYARYQSAVQMVDEIVDLSAFSTLGNYDEYLEERFCLLAVSQTTELEVDFSTYVEENLKTLGQTVSNLEIEAIGNYGLDTIEVLKQQLLESSEVSVLSEIIVNAFDVNDLMKEIIDSLNIDDITDTMETVQATADVAKSVSKIIEAVEEFNTYYTKDYATALKAYQNAATAFNTQANNLVEVLKTAEEEFDEEHKDDKVAPTAAEKKKAVYDDDNVKDALEVFNEAVDTYEEETDDFKDCYEKLMDYFETASDKITDLPEDISEFENSVEDDSLASQVNTSMTEWIVLIADELCTRWDSIVVSDFMDQADEDCDDIDDLIDDLKDIKDDTITSSWTSTKIKSSYAIVLPDSSISNFIADVSSAIGDLTYSEDVDDDTALGLMDLVDMVESIFNIEGIYDSNLNSVVSSSSFFNTISMNGSSQALIESISSFVKAAEEFVDEMTNFSVWTIFSTISVVIDLLDAVANLLSAIIQSIAEIITTLFDLFTSGISEIYNSLLLYGYGVYNLANRMTVYEGKSIYGYSFDKIYDLAGGESKRVGLEGTFNSLSTLSNTTGSDTMFKGAEAEYILIGSSSEIQNQIGTFFNLYLLRLALDIIPILTNSQLNTIAAATGFGAWIVKLVAVLVEPIVDSLLLVNGESECLIKETIYFSYTGFNVLVQELIGVTDFSDSVQEMFKDDYEANNGKASKTGYFDCDYTEHLLLLTFLYVDQDKFLYRLQNIIQMESIQYYAEDSYTFTLDEAYTYINSTVTYELNSLFGFDSLTANGAFTVVENQFSGY